MLALSGKVAAVVLLVAGVAGGAAVLSGQGTSPAAQTARACAETPMAVAPAAAERDVVLFLDASSHFLRGDYTSADRSFHRPDFLPKQIIRREIHCLEAGTPEPDHLWLETVTGEAVQTQRDWAIGNRRKLSGSTPSGHVVCRRSQVVQ